jgi:hypothetical protein
MNTDTPQTTIIPEIIDEPNKAGCFNDLETIGYLAAEISRLRGKLNELERWEQTAGDKLSEVCRHIEKTREVTEQRDRLAEAISRTLELTTHDDIYWAIEEIGRLCETTNPNNP